MADQENTSRKCCCLHCLHSPRRDIVRKHQAVNRALVSLNEQSSCWQGVFLWLVVRLHCCWLYRKVALLKSESGSSDPCWPSNKKREKKTM
jgi:hypothetical protein